MGAGGFARRAGAAEPPVTRRGRVGGPSDGGRGNPRRPDRWLVHVDAKPRRGHETDRACVRDRAIRLQCSVDDAEIEEALPLLEDLYWLVALTREEIRAAVRQSTARVAARDGTGRVVAFARAVSDGKCAWIYDVAVAAHLRNARLGAALMGVLLDHPMVRGVRHVRLSTKDAMPFYRRFGFCNLDEAPRHTWTSTEMIRTRGRGPGAVDQRRAHGHAGTAYRALHDVNDCNGAAPPPPVTVTVTDENGRVVNAAVNAAGNFSIAGGPELTAPCSAKLSDGTKTRAMVGKVTSGDCNSCHTARWPASVVGRERIYLEASSASASTCGGRRPTTASSPADRSASTRSPRSARWSAWAGRASRRPPRWCDRAELRSLLRYADTMVRAAHGVTAMCLFFACAAPRPHGELRGPISDQPPYVVTYSLGDERCSGAPRAARPCVSEVADAERSGTSAEWLAAIDCEERSERIVDALRHAQRARERRLFEPDASAREIFTETIKRLSKLPARLSFGPVCRGAKISVDDRHVPEESVGIVFSVDPGPHELRVDGFLFSARGTFCLHAAERRHVTFPPIPCPVNAPAPPSSEPPRPTARVGELCSRARLNSEDSATVTYLRSCASGLVCCVRPSSSRTVEAFCGAPAGCGTVSPVVENTSE